MLLLKFIEKVNLLAVGYAYKKSKMWRIVAAFDEIIFNIFIVNNQIFTVLLPIMTTVICCNPKEMKIDSKINLREWVIFFNACKNTVLKDKKRVFKFLI